MLETERLLIIPLSARQLRLWIENISALENELHCSYQAEPMTGSFLEIVKQQVPITEADEPYYLFHTFWFLIRKMDRTVIGSADFKNKPDEKSEVEIGYGLGSNFLHLGYMTEAIQAMCRWALHQNGIAHVIAETGLDHTASQNVLTRCGFKRYQQGETLWWKL
jgi:ribosomal-protein-alanine N-acetyltransferase